MNKICEKCKLPIESRRLKVLPDANFCAKCLGLSLKEDLLSDDDKVVQRKWEKLRDETRTRERRLEKENIIKEQEKRKVAEPIHTGKISFGRNSITNIAEELSGYAMTNIAPENTEFGKRVHAELEAYYRRGSTKTIDDFQESAAADISRHLERQSNMETEFYVYIESLNITGICDLLVLNAGKCLRLIDFKSTRSIDKNYYSYCEYQLNLYRLALADMGYDVNDMRMDIICPSGVITVNKLDLTLKDIARYRALNLKPDNDIPKIRLMPPPSPDDKSISSIVLWFSEWALWLFFITMPIILILAAIFN